VIIHHWIFREIIFKLTTYNFYFWHNRLHTRNIFSCPECLKSQKVAFILHASFLMRNFLLLLNILPAGSDLPSNPPTGWRLCCCLSTSLSLPSLSLRQGRCFDTKHKHKLQAVNQRFKDLKFMMLNWLNSD